MLKKPTHTALSVATIFALSTVPLFGTAQAQGAATANLSGSYQCQPDPMPCLWPGASPSISQSGDKLQIKNEKGETADGRVTSDITLNAGGPLNSLGIVRGDHSIDWSDGTKWRKQ